jgi:hypothetical protein
MNVTKELLNTKKNKNNNWKRKNLSAMMNSLKKIKQVKKRKKSVATLTSVIGDIANITSKIIANIIMDGNHP